MKQSRRGATTAATDDQTSFLTELEAKLPADLFSAISKRDGAFVMAERLPQVFKPSEVIHETSPAQRGWELAGLYFHRLARHHEALSIFRSLYHQLLLGQQETSQWAYKAVPLLWTGECYKHLGFPVHSKRYLMLSLCEEAVRHKGAIPPAESGNYFRLVWGSGVSHIAFERYSKSAYERFEPSGDQSWFPEWILQTLDQDWMTEFSSPSEATNYVANPVYARYLLDGLGESTGKRLEQLVEYLLACMPGCRIYRRIRSRSTDYDLICSVDGVEIDFRSEFGRYFVCECKDWNGPADFTTMAKFCRVLDSVKSRFGILFSRQGVSGAQKSTGAAREQLKVFQDRGIVIIVINRKELEKVVTGTNFISLLRRKYESVRLDVREKRETTQAKKVR